MQLINSLKTLALMLRHAHDVPDGTLIEGQQ